MTSEIWAAVIGGVAGLASGVVASLLAPWANWSIEKRRLKRQRRYGLLDRWRQGIASAEDADDHTTFLTTEWYETLRPHLSSEARKQLEAERTWILPSDSGRGVRNSFTGEVDRIEREWGLRP